MYAPTEARSQNGFIAVVALGMFALMAFFGIIIQLQVVHTYKSIKATNNYYHARAIAGSMQEYLRFVLKNREAGYNTVGSDGGTVIECDFPDGPDTDTTGMPVECLEIPRLLHPGDRVNVKMEIKGRALEAERLVTNNCYADFGAITIDQCYTVPFPGTGNASDLCKFYEPVFGTMGDSFVNETIAGRTGLDQLDYACNWNRLFFGSNLTDRVSIPLYYDSGDANSTTVSPYNENIPEEDRATDFILRLRTPCLPCVYSMDEVENENGAAINRYCQQGQDPNSCDVSERYDLDDNSSEIVAQWQIAGQCEIGGNIEECGMIPVNDDRDERFFSAFSESRINASADENYVILRNADIGYSVLENSLVYINNPIVPVFPSYIPLMINPALNLFLSEPLIATSGRNVPYLEYQLLSDKPVSFDGERMEVKVNVNGNNYNKTLYKKETVDLIDFAVQN